MTAWATSNNVLKDFGQPNIKSRTFSIPINMKSLKINTIYQFLVSNVNMGWACKPFGGTLGANLVSSANGTLKFHYYFDQRHNQGIISGGNGQSQNNGPLISRLLCEVVDSSNNATFFYIPVHLKLSQ